MNLPGNPYLPPGCTEADIAESAGSYRRDCTGCWIPTWSDELNEEGLCDGCENGED